MSKASIGMAHSALDVVGLHWVGRLTCRNALLLVMVVTTCRASRLAYDGLWLDSTSAMICAHTELLDLLIEFIDNRKCGRKLGCEQSQIFARIFGSLFERYGEQVSQ
jgi:hypothetical protein